jgi:hypothetical protein
VIVVGESLACPNVGVAAVEGEAMSVAAGPGEEESLPPFSVPRLDFLIRSILFRKAVAAVTALLGFMTLAFNNCSSKCCAARL